MGAGTLLFSLGRPVKISDHLSTDLSEKWGEACSCLGEEASQQR